MSPLMWLTALLAGVVHVVIFCMESLWWTSPKVRRRFRQSPEQAEATRLFAFNCLSMLGAAVVLAASAPRMRRGALIQGGAPLLFFLLAAVRG
ncbi:MAG TPA: DUF1304 family protein [Gemmatimonadales bacterium]|jgi:putative membrane protein